MAMEEISLTAAFKWVGDRISGAWSDRGGWQEDKQPFSSHHPDYSTIASCFTLKGQVEVGWRRRKTIVIENMRAAEGLGEDERVGYEDRSTNEGVDEDGMYGREQGGQ
ncbi:unnamed protein product [Hydatigera taeniaeformis]|uniref:Uncharacterized protein n=1 Tax=Hydatigena taeniaeformis TaxID=6205 RepID=A0A0R3X159_HYDTA|nr:unnamed protein product [Hydatigera taeniaeformis]